MQNVSLGGIVSVGEFSFCSNRWPVVDQRVCLTSAGKAVFLARDKHHLSDLCHLIRHEAPYLFQEYVKESHGRDVRVVLVGGRVIGSMLRCSTDGRMQSNCSLGTCAISLYFFILKRTGYVQTDLTYHRYAGDLK